MERTGEQQRMPGALVGVVVRVMYRELSVTRTFMRMYTHTNTCILG